MMPDLFLKTGVIIIFCISVDIFLQTYHAPVDNPVIVPLWQRLHDVLNTKDNMPMPESSPPPVEAMTNHDFVQHRPPPTVSIAQGSVLGSAAAADGSSLLSRTFQTLTHALDPVPAIEGRVEVKQPQTATMSSDFSTTTPMMMTASTDEKSLFRADLPLLPPLPASSSSSSSLGSSISPFSVSSSSTPPSTLPFPSPSALSSVANSPWTWANYSRLPDALWPECSKLPNCLKFDYGVDGCERWRQISSYPVLVGDMDGSGSRGITWLLRAGGVWMRTTNEWLDWAKQEHPLSNKIMEATHSLDYQFKKLPLEVRKRSEEQVKEVLKEFANVAQTQLGKWSNRKLKPWEVGLDANECPRRMGWKHGPTLFLQPIYQHVTGGKFTFVHLIRDGRDMAFSRNRNNLAKYPKYGGQVVGLFKLGKTANYNKCFFKPDEKHSAERDKECILMQMRLWEKMNLGAATYGSRELGSRYIPVRVEDLILPRDPNTRADAILLFFRRLGVNTVTSRPKALELSKRIFGSASLRSHFSIERWGGCKASIIDEVEGAGKNGLFHFGYATWRELEQTQAEEQGGPPQGGNGCSVGSNQIQVPGTAGMQKKGGGGGGHRRRLS